MDPFLVPFWTPVGCMLACFSSPIGVWGSIWRLHGTKLWPFLSPRCLLSPRWRHCWLMGSFLGPFLLVLRSHLLLLSSIFGVHVVLIWVVFEVSLTSISFVHALHSKKELVSESFTWQVKVFPKYVTKTALQAHSSCRAKHGTYV